jgi:hypothetical protein
VRRETHDDALAREFFFDAHTHEFVERQAAMIPFENFHPVDVDARGIALELCRAEVCEPFVEGREVVAAEFDDVGIETAIVEARDRSVIRAAMRNHAGCGEDLDALDKIGNRRMLEMQMIEARVLADLERHAGNFKQREELTIGNGGSIFV